VLKVSSDELEELKAAHLTFVEAKRFLLAHPSAGEETSKVNDIKVGRSASAAIKRAESLAKKNGEHLVWTFHLLLALLNEEQGPACEVLNAHGVDRAKLREWIQQQLDAAELVRREKRKRRRLRRAAELHPEFWANPPREPSPVQRAQFRA